MRKLDLIGCRFTSLTVVGSAGVNKHHESLWECQCDCGRAVTVVASHLRRGSAKSCGCYRLSLRTTHGHSRKGQLTLTYRIWQHMRTRCYNPGDNRYSYYGARGIKVCDRWNKFENFLEDMGECPVEMSIDRINNDGDYEPGNCRWATRSEQMNNRTVSRAIEWLGETRTLTEWARRLEMPMKTLWARLYVCGWSVNRALSTPIGMNNGIRSRLHN